MTYRVTDKEVQEVVETSRDTKPFIETANLIVTEHLVSAAPAAPLSTGMLKAIELYLAAHFTALTEERGSLIRSGVGEAAETLSDIYGEGFKSTRYGQQALALDTTGVLAALSNQKLKAQFRVV